MRRSGRLLPWVGLALLVLVLLLAVVLAWRLVSPSAGLVTAGIAVFAVLVAAAVLVLPAQLVARDTNGAVLGDEQRASAINSARSTMVQGLVGLAALAGIFVAWQQLQTDQEQSRTDRAQLTEQLELTRQGQVAERFTRAVDQLGSDKLEQRFGGIYGLERIAEESTSTRLQVFEVLTAYVRERAPRDPKAAETSLPDQELGARAPDVQAVLTVLARRTPLPGDARLDLRETDLRRADLSGARLQNADLLGAQLQGANLLGAQLQRADLSGAQLQSARLSSAQLQRADLSRAQLQRATLIRAQLQGAYLIRAQLQGAYLIRAQLQGAYLPDAQLQGAFLSYAELRGANLRDAKLQGAILGGAQLQGANLRDAKLRGARDTARTAWPNGFDPEAAGVIH